MEAIALAHDLGHTPFGHAGQDTLNECMAAHGGFEHNLQSLRVVDHLEARYPAFDGLNLSFETREGVLKHCSRQNAEIIEAKEPGGVARRFLNRTQPSLEAQLCNLADAIAYNAHDIDDGVRSGLITLEQLQSIELFERFQMQALRAHPDLAQAQRSRRWLYETIRLMLSEQVYDVIAATQHNLQIHRPQNADEARQAGPLVAFSAQMKALALPLKQFLFTHLYRHPQVMNTTLQAQQVVRDLYEAYVAAPSEMPQDFASREDTHRAVADYIAGMTDRYAAREHERLTGRKWLA